MIISNIGAGFQVRICCIYLYDWWSVIVPRNSSMLHYSKSRQGIISWSDTVALVKTKTDTIDYNSDKEIMGKSTKDSSIIIQHYYKKWNPYLFYNNTWRYIHVLSAVLTHCYSSYHCTGTVGTTSLLNSIQLLIKPTFDCYTWIFVSRGHNKHCWNHDKRSYPFLKKGQTIHK